MPGTVPLAGAASQPANRSSKRCAWCCLARATAEKQDSTPLLRRQLVDGLELLREWHRGVEHRPDNRIQLAEVCVSLRLRCRSRECCFCWVLIALRETRTPICSKVALTGLYPVTPCTCCQSAAPGPDAKAEGCSWHLTECVSSETPPYLSCCIRHGIGRCMRARSRGQPPAS